MPFAFVWCRALGCSRRILALAALSFFCSAARAETDLVAVETTGSCPAAADVEKELQRIVPSVRLTRAALDSAASELLLEEGASGVTVTFRGSRRYFDDEARRCRERASQVAVFVALILDPLRLPMAQAERQVSRAQQPGAALAPERAHLELEIGPKLSVALASGLRATPLAGGGGVRLRWGDTLSLSAGAALMSTTTLHYAQAEATELLVPIDVGARLIPVRGAAWGDWDFAAEASLVAAPAYLKGQDLDLTKAGWRLELGARAALLLRWWVAERVGLFVSESALWWPSPVALRVGGVGEVGHTPQFWLGTELGLALKIN